MNSRVKAVIADVALRTGVSIEDILGPARQLRYAHPRHLAMAGVRALQNTRLEPAYSYPAIGKIFSRDHSTVMAGCRAAERRHGPLEPSYPIAVYDVEETRL